MLTHRERQKSRAIAKGERERERENESRRRARERLYDCRDRRLDESIVETPVCLGRFLSLSLFCWLRPLLECATAMMSGGTSRESFTDLYHERGSRVRPRETESPRREAISLALSARSCIPQTGLRGTLVDYYLTKCEYHRGVILRRRLLLYDSIYLFFLITH